MIGNTFNQLPANPLQIQSGWYNLNPSMPPPYVPAVSQDPQIQSMVPLIALTACSEIQSQAQQQPNNPLRVHMFNLYTQNNFQNEQFEALIAAATDFVWVYVMKGAFRTVEEAIQDCVPKMVAMLAAMQLRQYPALEQYTNPTMQYSVNELMGHFQTLSNEIRAAKARMPQQPQQSGGWNQQQNWNQPQTGWNQQPSWNQQPQQSWSQQPSRQWGPSGGAAWQPPSPQPTPLGGGNSTLFGGGSAQPQSFAGSAEKPAMSAGRFDQSVLRQPFEPRKEETVQQAPAPVAPTAPPIQPAPQPTSQLIPAAQVRFRPTKDNPYVPAYNPLEFELFFEPQPDGGMKPKLQPRSEKLDYERHAVSTTFGPRARELDTSKQAQVLERIQKGVESINAPQEQPETGEVADDEVTLPFYAMTRENLLLDSSETLVWLTAGLERMGQRVDERIPDIYRVWAKVAEPIVGLQDETPFVRNFASCESFLDLRDKLNAAVNRISSGLWGAAEMRMTRAVNRMLKQNLSIPKLSIDSFTADIEDLLKLLENRYGELITGAIKKHEAEVIRQVFGCLCDAEAEALSESHIDPKDYPEDAQPRVTYLSSAQSFTLLNCRAHELNIELAADVGAFVHPRATPVMHALLKGLFDAAHEVELAASKQGMECEFHRHLIRTADGRILEATRGFLSDDHFLLTLVE